MIGPDSKIEIGAPPPSARHRRSPASGRWRNPQKLGRELVAAADVDRLDRVGQPELFQKNNALLAVSGRPEIQINHGTLSCFLGPEVWIVAIAGSDCPPLKEPRRGGLLASDRRGNYHSGTERRSASMASDRV
jgi:hypothetical protein